MKNPESEQLLCSRLIVDGMQIFKRVRSLVKSEHFRDPECRKIYQYFESRDQERDFDEMSHIIPGSRLYWYMDGMINALGFGSFPERLAIEIWEKDRWLRLKEAAASKEPDYQKIAKICETNPGTAENQFLSLEDIFTNPVINNPIINGLLDDGDNMIIYSPGGVGKSLITLHIALNLACGEDFLGFPVPKPRNTLFLQSENSRTATYSRLLKIFDGEPDLKIGLQQIFFPQQIQIAGFFTNPDFKIRIENLIQIIEEKTQEKLDVIIIDPLISFHDADENDNSRMRSTLDCLQEICNKTKTVPIVVHHANKENGIRGASSITDWARVVLKIEKKVVADRDFIELSCEKSNNHPRFQPFAIQFDEFLCPKNLENRGLDEKKAAQCEMMAKALDLLGGTAKSQRDLIRQYTELSGLKSRSAIISHIHEAVKFGYIDMIEADEEGIKAISYKLKN
jgi:hypothetical protein